MKTISLVSVLALALMAMTANAGGYGEHKQCHLKKGLMPFESLDLNRDGVITPQEHAQVEQKQKAQKASCMHKKKHKKSYKHGSSFEQLDSNADGALSKEEIIQWSQHNAHGKKGHFCRHGNH